MIIISGQDQISTAVELLKSGAFDYLVKDEATKDLLWNTVVRIRENQTLKKEVEHLREELGQKYSFQKTLIGQSENLKKVFTSNFLSPWKAASFCSHLIGRRSF